MTGVSFFIFIVYFLFYFIFYFILFHFTWFYFCSLSG